MKRLSFAVPLMMLVLMFTPSVAAVGSRVKDSLIVSTEWLAKRLNDDSIVLLQVGDKAEYEAGHIPGARNDRGTT